MQRSKAFRRRKRRSHSRAAPYRARPHRWPWRQTRDFRPARSIFCTRRKRQTCCSCTSPSSAAIKSPFQRAKPAGGSRSRTARMRRPVSLVYFGAGPGRGLSAKPAKPSRANRPRQVLTVRGIVPSARAIERVEWPSSASKTIRARNASRCSVVGARTRASSTARSAGVSRTFAAMGIIPMLNHELAFRKSGY